MRVWAQKCLPANIFWSPDPDILPPTPRILMINLQVSLKSIGVLMLGNMDLTVRKCTHTLPSFPGHANSPSLKSSPPGQVGAARGPWKGVGGMEGGMKGTEGERPGAEVGSESVLPMNRHKQGNSSEPCKPGGLGSQSLGCAG